jgi:hypothetical protein
LITSLPFNPQQGIHYTEFGDRDRLAPITKPWSAKMAKRGLDGRHRDTTGRIDKKHGNTRVASLRKTYGEHFAKGRRKDMMLKALLAETGRVTSRLSAQTPQVIGCGGIPAYPR